MARSRFQGKSQSSASRKSLWLPSCQIDELSDISRREVALSLSRTFPVERGSNAFKNRDGARRVAVLLGETPTAVHRRLQNFSSAAAAQLSSSTAETMRSRRSSSASSGSRSAAAGGAPPVAEEDADDSLDESVVRTVVQYAAHMSSGSASSSSAVGSASGHKSASAADSADGAQPAIGALLRAQWDGRLPTAASDPAQTSTVMSAPAVAASSAPSTAVEASSTATGSSCRPTDLLRQPRLQINNRVLKRLRDGRDLTYLGEQDTSESANAVQQPSASSTAGGYVTCGPCGSRRYVAVPSLCYKFGSWVCLHCIKFILKMLKNGSSSLKCLDQHGCAIGPSVSADPSDAGPAADPVDPESRCPACWLQRCLLALNFAEERHTRLRCCLPRALQSAVPPFSRKARCETGRCEPAPPPSLLPAVSAAVPVNGVAGGGAKLWSVPAAPGFEVISRTSAPQLPTSQTASVQPAVFSGEPPVVSSAEPLAVSSAEPLAASSAEPPLRRKTVVVVQLGDGWRRRETVRKGGRLDRVVCSPGGMRFKSVVELQAHLRSSGCPPSSAKDYFFREATAAVKQKTPLTDQAPRNSCAKRGPRVKLVCRSASVALGQPRATFADLHADVAPVPQLAPAQSSLPPSPPSTPPPPAQPDREEEEDSATPQPSGSAAVASTSPASRDSRTRLRRKRRRKLVVEDRGSRNIRLKLKVLNKYKHLKSARAATGLKSARAGAGLKPGSGRVRMSRCRACAGCRSKNCRQCVFCHDMVKYGGPGKLKKSCVARTCKRPLLPGVSELKFQTSAAGGSDAVDAVKPRGCRGRAPGTSAVRRTPSALYKSRLHRPLLHPLGQQGVRKRLAFRKRAAGVRQLHRPQTDGLDEAAGEDDAADTSSVLLDTWLPEDLGEIWRHGLAVVLTEPLEVPLLCFICGSHGSEELVFCNSCCEPFHAFCLDECEVPVTAGQLDSWLCRRCQLCAICGCPAADDDQLLARCRQCNDTFHRACGDPHSCVDDAKLADRQPWMYVGWPQQPAPPHALPVTPPPSPLPLHTAASPLPPPSFQSLYCPWCPDDLPKVTSLPLQAPPVQASVVDEQSGQKSVVVDSADESAPFLGFPADELRLSKPVAQVECVEKVPEVVEVKRKSVTKKTTSDVVRRSSRSTRGRHSWKERDSASAAVAAAEPEKSTEPPAPVESESMQPDVAAEGQEDVVEPAAVTGPAVLTSAPPTTPELKSHMVVVSVPVEWRFITQHEALQMVYAGMSCLPPSSGDQLERFGLQYRLETAAVGVRPLLQRLDRDVDRQLQRLGYPPSQQRLRRRRHSSGVSVEQLPRLVAGRDRQRHGSGPPIPLERCGFSEQDWLYWRSLLPRRIGRPRKYPRQNDLDMIAVLQQSGVVVGQPEVDSVLLERIGTLAPSHAVSPVELNADIVEHPGADLATEGLLLHESCEGPEYMFIDENYVEEEVFAVEPLLHESPPVPHEEEVVHCQPVGRPRGSGRKVSATGDVKEDPYGRAYLTSRGGDGTRLLSGGYGSLLGKRKRRSSGAKVLKKPRPLQRLCHESDGDTVTTAKPVKKRGRPSKFRVPVDGAGAFDRESKRVKREMLTEAMLIGEAEEQVHDRQHVQEKVNKWMGGVEDESLLSATDGMRVEDMTIEFVSGDEDHAEAGLIGFESESRSRFSSGADAPDLEVLDDRSDAMIQNGQYCSYDASDLIAFDCDNSGSSAPPHRPVLVASPEIVFASADDPVNFDHLNIEFSTSLNVPTAAGPTGTRPSFVPCDEDSTSRADQLTDLIVKDDTSDVGDVLDTSASLDAVVGQQLISFTTDALSDTGRSDYDSAVGEVSREADDDADHDDVAPDSAGVVDDEFLLSQLVSMESDEHESD